MHKKEQINRQNAIIMIGFFAILIVIAISVYRSDTAENSKKVDDVNSLATNLEYYPIIGPDLSQRISKNDIQIIDTRSIVEFGLEHIPDSINVPLENLEKSSLINLEKDIVLIGSANEDDIKNAISILNKKTDKKVFLLQGGFVDWKAIGETTVSWGDISSFSEQSKTSFITMDEFKEKLKSGSPIFLIDARKNIFYNEGHISDAINIPLSEIEKRRDEIDISKEIIIYSESELEAFQEAVKLFDMKMVPSKVLRGGFKEWKDKGYVVTK